MQQAIEELWKGRRHLQKATKMQDILQPYADNPYPCLLLGRAIRTIGTVLEMLKLEQAKEEPCKP